MSMVLFEDGAVEQLYPITLARSAMNILCGAYRLADWARQHADTVRYLVRPHLQAVTHADAPDATAAIAPHSRPILCINARLVPSAQAFQELQRIQQAGRSCVLRNGDTVAAALLPGSELQGELPSCDAFCAWLASHAMNAFETRQVELPLFQLPHEVIAYHLQTLPDQLRLRLTQGTYRELAPGLYAAEGVRIVEPVTIDTTQGPIVLEQGAVVEPYCLLKGPLYLGPNALVFAHTVLRPFVSCGTKSRMCGEIAASIIESFSNKSHYGYLGHSYLGSWVNLGAGTSNSDLKNTYGEVRIQYPQGKIGTGMQFCGCMIGDYTKTAIHTSIFTGKLIGVAALLYGPITANVPSFVNYGPSLGPLTEIAPQVTIETQRRAFQRRGMTPRPCDEQLIRDVHRLTVEHRQALGHSLPVAPPQY